MSRVQFGQSLSPKNTMAPYRLPTADELNSRLLEADALCSTLRPSRVPAMQGSQRIAIVSLLFNWPSTGGGIIHTAELAQFLSAAGYDVRHFYASNPDWRVGQLTEDLSYPSEAIAFQANDWSESMIVRKFRSAIEQYDPSCVIVTDSWNSKPLLAEAVAAYPYMIRLAAMECLCPLNNVRLLFTENGEPVQCSRSQFAHRTHCVGCVNKNARCSGQLHRSERELVDWAGPEYDTRLHEAFRGAHAVLAVNRYIAALVEPYTPQVQVVPSGFDRNRFADLPIRSPGTGPFRFLFAGLTEECMKGFQVLATACQILWTRRRALELWVTADTCQLDLPFVKLCGWQSQEQLPGLIADCDAVVIPTIAQEALGRTAVEAMGAGRAVIASRIGGLPETVCEGLTGLLVPPADADSLARAMERLIDSPELTSRLGRNGRDRFNAIFPWEKIIEQHYVPLFNSCGNRHEGRLGIR